MSLASDALRAEAARFRRLKFLVTDPQALAAIEDYACELDQRANAIEDAMRPRQPCAAPEDRDEP